MTTTAGDDAQQTADDIARRLEASRLDIEERMDRLSQQLLGKPYQRSVGAPASEVLGDPMTAAEDSVRAVRQRVFSLVNEQRDYARQISDDPRWSEEYRQQQIEALRKSHAAEAEAVAASAWHRMGLAEAVLQEQQQAAERAVDAAVNPVAVRALAEDYRSRLDLADGDGMTATEGRLRAISEWMDQAEASGDPVRLRAVRIASTPVLAQARSGEGDIGGKARALHRRARDLLALERADADRAAHALKSVRSMRQVLRAEIEQAETRLTGQKATVFDISPWQRRIFGDTPESRGGGVVRKAK